MEKLIRIYQKLFIPKLIFSPLSGGKLKPKIVIKELSIQGKIKLTTK